MKKINDENKLLFKKIINQGERVLSSSDLISIILSNTNLKKNIDKEPESPANNLDPQKIVDCSAKELIEKYGVIERDAIIIAAVTGLSRRLLKDDAPILPQIKTPYDAINYLWDIREKKKEYFVGLYLNSRNQVIAKEIISVGTLNASIVHPREVFEPAIRLNSASIIVSHNHPSGDTQPSEADIQSTKQLKKAGEILGIDLIDHLVVSKSSFTSLKTKGYI